MFPPASLVIVDRLVFVESATSCMPLPVAPAKAVHVPETICPTHIFPEFVSFSAPWVYTESALPLATISPELVSDTVLPVLRIRTAEEPDPLEVM